MLCQQTVPAVPQPEMYFNFFFLRPAARHVVLSPAEEALVAILEISIVIFYTLFRPEVNNEERAMKSGGRSRMALHCRSQLLRWIAIRLGVACDPTLVGRNDFQAAIVMVELETPRRTASNRG